MPRTMLWLPALSIALAASLSGCAPAGDPEPTPPGTALPTESTPIPTQGSPTAYWSPAPGASWQWQLSDLPADLSIEADVFDLDLFETEPQAIAELHAAGKRVICYISVGSWEEWRPDASAFPAEVIGKRYEGWPGERWLDIRRIDLLEPVLTARLSLCREKGFDAVEPDNIDGYDNDTGFEIGYEDQLRFNRWLADEAHSLGLSIGLKNDPQQAAELVADFDWALTEDCCDQGWCDLMAPFLEAGKAVLVAEYTDTGVDFAEACTALAPRGFSLILKDRSLTADRDVCDPES